MNIDWQNVGYILGVLGTFFGGGWILNFYNAKPKKNSIEIDNMKKIVDELQDVIADMREHNLAYRSETEKKIKELNEKIAELSQRLDEKHEAIFSACRCTKIDSLNDCVVWRAFKERESKNKENNTIEE